MIKFGIVVIFATILALPGQVKAEILRCMGEINWNGTTSKEFMGQPLGVQLDIVVPEDNDEIFTGGLLSTKGVFDQFGKLDSVYHRGTIEISESLGEGKTKVIKNQGRYDLVVTQIPSNGYSLIGFMIPDGIHIWSIRVDTWDKGKPFYLYRSDMNEFIVGTCDDNSL